MSNIIQMFFWGMQNYPPRTWGIVCKPFWTPKAIKTYEQHYGSGKIQSTEFIFDSGHGESFCLGNMIKYAQRYGKKYDRKDDIDLYKVIHYAIILLGEREKEREEDERIQFLKSRRR